MGRRPIPLVQHLSNGFPRLLHADPQAAGNFITEAWLCRDGTGTSTTSLMKPLASIRRQEQEPWRCSFPMRTCLQWVNIPAGAVPRCCAWMAQPVFTPVPSGRRCIKQSLRANCCKDMCCTDNKAYECAIVTLQHIEFAWSSRPTARLPTAPGQPPDH